MINIKMSYVKLQINERQCDRNMNSVDQVKHNEIQGRHKINKIIQEILSTEKTYIKILNVINFDYKNKSEDPTMRLLLPANFDSKFKIIFFNTDKLQDFHEELLEELEKSTHSLDSLAECFTKREGLLLDLYVDFCTNQHHCFEATNSLELQPFLSECQKKLNDKLNLNAHLLTPIQRITKYRLLLEDLLRQTQNERLTCALNCISNTLDKINKNLSCNLKGLPDELRNKGSIILQGEFKVTKSNNKYYKIKSVRKHLFLFETIIIFSTPIVSHKGTTFQYDNHLKLSELGISKSRVEKPKVFLLSAIGKDEEYFVKAPTEMESQVWQDKINDILLSQLKNIKSLRRIRKHQETSDFQFEKDNAKTIASIVDAEEAYVRNLQNFFKEFDLKSLRPSEYLMELEAIIGNLDQIYKFHSDTVLRELRKCTKVESLLIYFEYLKRKFQILYNYYFQNLSRSTHYLEVMNKLTDRLRVDESQLVQKLLATGALLQPVKRIALYERHLVDIKLYRHDLRTSKQKILSYLRDIINSMKQSLSTIQKIEDFPFHVHQGGLIMETEMGVSVSGRKMECRHVFFFDHLTVFTVPKNVGNTKKYQVKEFLKNSHVVLTHDADDRKLKLFLNKTEVTYTCLTNNLDEKRILVKHFSSPKMVKVPDFKCSS